MANAKKNFQMRQIRAGNANHINPRSFGGLVLPKEEGSQGQRSKECRKRYKTKS